MISVSLKDLLLIPGAYHRTPEDFRALMATCEESPDDRNAFGPVADWCEEHDEIELAEAFRFLQRKDKVGIRFQKRASYEDGYWTMIDLPPAIQAVYFDQNPVNQTPSLAYRVAGLCHQIARVKEQL